MCKSTTKGYIFTLPGQMPVVFDGVVERRFSLPGSGNAIIIQHEITAHYTETLRIFYVRTGDRVKAKQAIGQIYTDDENGGKTELIFQVWSD